MMYDVHDLVLMERLLVLKGRENGALLRVLHVLRVRRAQHRE